ncbi:MAG: rRNA adenine N-6-methyltransferase family protein [Pseudomonadota bacterium]
MSDRNREALVQFLLGLRSRGITDHRLLSAFEDVPRRNFVPVIHITEAYASGQMPIECGQSMTAVSRVAQILAALEIDPEHRVAELGTGTGYQTALISKLAKKVLSFERYRTLQEKADLRIRQLGIDNVVVRLADASGGDVVLGTNDRIIANFAFPDIPRDYFDNLTANGVMIAAIGPENSQQMMKKITKVGARMQVEDLFPVRMQHSIAGISKAI